MEKLINKYENLVKVRKKLSLAINKYTDPPSYADSEDIEAYMTTLIKRFELTYELIWKFLKAYLNTQNIKTLGSKDVFRVAFDLKLISEEQAAALLNCVDDRNATAHDYDEQYAKIMCDKVVMVYDSVFGEIISNLKNLILK